MTGRRAGAEQVQDRMIPASPSTRRPTVSIGLPVYNGERYLVSALDSILAQTLADFELIIADNASTDRTEAICREYAARDTRIHYHRHPKNIGGFQNHNYTFTLATGIYFRFAAHDDVCAADMLARCVQALEQHPQAVLSYPVTVRIDEDGHPLREVRQQKGTSSRPYDRFRGLTGWDHDCEPIYGLIRSEVLADIHRKTGLLHSYTDADRTLLCQLSLYGEFVQVPQPLFYRRIHPGTSTKTFPGWRERMAWSYPSGEDPITLPHWQQFLHYLHVVAAAPMEPVQRLRCYLHVVRWATRERRWGKMIKDFYYAGAKAWRYSRATV